MEAVYGRPSGRKMETFLTEFNIQATWEPFERRHGNNVGAVFLASTVRRTALAGVSGTRRAAVQLSSQATRPIQAPHASGPLGLSGERRLVEARHIVLKGHVARMPRSHHVSFQTPGTGTG